MTGAIKDHRITPIPSTSWREASLFKVMQAHWVRDRANKGWIPSFLRAHELSMLGRGLVFVIPEALGDAIALVGQFRPHNASPGGSRGRALGTLCTCSSSEQMRFGRQKVGALPSFPPVCE